ncbi:protein WVD2-like 7 [Populus nigra]|uniref:protein WVD2-like 7 n=1 Tax=Populus nigra TaxID=3691 RepID=UPI002B275D64|nr:protein WVD2-like 7 [Populus nigra]
MGESACLLRSFSHPSSASREAKEDNPIRALTESISFGRFMSESLAWEKWSTFSHNRYLEEVEQFSKPGSVAQKKAYFEAHYKKRAAMKAAALLEQANAASNVPEVEAADEALNSSHVNSELPKETNDVIINEQDEGSVDAGVIQSSDANAFYADELKDNLQNAKEEGNEEVREKNVAMENSIQVENVKENENAEDSDIIVAMPEEKIPNKVSCHSNQVAAEEENVTLPSNERQSKSSSQSRASILPKSSAKLPSSARLRAETNDTPNIKKSAGELMNKKRVTPKSIHMSINFASQFQDTSESSLRVSKFRSATPEIPTKVANAKQIENAQDSDTANKVSCHSTQVAAEEENVALPSNKRQMSSSSKSSSQSRATKLPKSSAKLSSSTRLRAETNATTNSKKSAGGLMDKKGVTQKSIHMSINFSSRLQDTNKSSLRVSKDMSATPEISTKGSVYGVSKLLPSVFRRSQDRRTKSELNKSVSGKITAGGISQTLSSDCSKSSSAKGSKSRPPLISSPFSFRSDERAAKRKEFFEKLGEKNNAKEDTEKRHLQARPKEKAEYDIKKLRQSAVFGGKPRDDLHRGLRSPENSTMKIPLTRPRSPKLGRKSTSNVASSKPVIQRSNHSSTRSITLLPKKNTHENASPNIQP